MPDTPANPLIGTWRLVSLEYATAGEMSYPFGRAAQGYITYTPDGFRFAAVASGERPPFARADQPLAGTLEEKAAAAGSYLTYCGRYEYFPDRVVHHVENSRFPNWVGQQQVRYHEFAGDRMTRKSRWTPADGRPQEARMIWERA